MIVGEIVDDIVCFMNQQFVCGEILWMKVNFKEIIDMICSYIGQIQCGGIGVVEIGVFVEQFVDNINVGGCVLFGFEWEVSSEDSVVQIVCGIVVQMVVVQLCVLIVGGGEQFVMYWIVYDSYFSMVFNVYSNGNSEVWQMFDEVGGVIQWIDNLLNILICVNVFIVFFGDNSVLWVRFVNGVDNYCFSGFIYIGYKIVIVFLVCFYSVWSFIVFGNYIICFVCCVYGDGQYWMYWFFLLDVKEWENGVEYSSEIGICFGFMVRCQNNFQLKKDNVVKYLNCVGGNFLYW